MSVTTSVEAALDWRQHTLPSDLTRILSRAPSVQVVRSVAELVEQSGVSDRLTEVAYDVPGRGPVVEATTGALMLLSPDFRNAGTGVFDRDYWMYGEDLQLCADAQAAGRRVVILERPGSVHLKGHSSGFPRGSRSDRAFHQAMLVYYRKNLRRHAAEEAVVTLGVGLRYVASRVAALAATTAARVRP